MSRSYDHRLFNGSRFIKLLDSLPSRASAKDAWDRGVFGTCDSYRITQQLDYYGNTMFVLWGGWS